MTDRSSRAWVRQPSGRRLDLVNPTPFDWDDEDLAVGLARTFRWGGHSIWPLPLSVAQHSLFVLELSRKASGGKLSNEALLRELLHDAEEGLVGFDPISPLKPILGQEFRKVMDRLQHAVFTRYGVRPWNSQEKRAHKKADHLAAASEAVHVAGWTESEAAAVLGIKQKPLATDILAAVYGAKEWEPWPSDTAAERFLAALHELTKAG